MVPAVTLLNYFPASRGRIDLSESDSDVEEESPAVSFRYQNDAAPQPASPAVSIKDSTIVGSPSSEASFHHDAQVPIFGGLMGHNEDMPIFAGLVDVNDRGNDATLREVTPPCDYGDEPADDITEAIEGLGPEVSDAPAKKMKKEEAQKKKGAGGTAE